MSRRPPYLLHEYGDAVPVDMSASELLEVEEVAGIWKRRLGLARDPIVVHRPRIATRTPTLEARDVTGVIRVGTMDIEIAPKFLDGVSTEWRTAMLNILVAVDQLVDEQDTTSLSLTPLSSLADLFAHVMIQALDRSISTGLPRGYVERAGLTEVLRGRLDLRQIVVLATRRDVVPSTFDEFSVDTDVNRLLKRALTDLLSEVRSSLLRVRVEEWLTHFRDTATLPPASIVLPRHPLPLQHQALAPAVRVARLLLEGRGLQHAAGLDEAPGFLWRSSSVFEAFADLLIANLCRSRPGYRFTSASLDLAMPAKGPSLPSGYVESTHVLTSEPDQRIQYLGSDALVLDAKYKIWRGSPISSDTYQVMAGGRLGSCGDVVLIYPAPGGGRRPPTSWVVAAPGIPTRVSAVFIDLTRMAEVFGLRELHRQLATDLRPLLP